MNKLLPAFLVIGPVLVAGCDKGQSNTQPASPAQTAAPAPPTPMIANTESTMPTTMPQNITPGGSTLTLPSANR